MEKRNQYVKKKICIVPLIYFLLLLIPFTEGQAQNQVIINPDNTHQIIRGFGAANILPWRSDMTANEINRAFGTGDGQLGFSILRLRLPSDANTFSLNLPTATAAYSMGVTLIASPWSPPASMKSNNNIVGGELKEDSYDDYAAHLKNFADYMSDNGASIYAISVQNEPDVSVSYESCDWNSSQMLKFVKENARSIGTKVIAPESFQFRRNLSDPLLNDSAALANFDILGGHIYGGGLAPYPLAEEKGKEIWMTEYLTNSGSPPANIGIDTGWTGAIQIAGNINDCLNANMSAYVWWYIVRYYGPISDGTYTTKGDITKKGYVMSQFARFIRPGFFRIDATENPQTGVNITAYKKGERIVIVAINNNASPVTQTFDIQTGPAGTFTPYITSQTKNCVQESDIATANGSFTISLNGSSITTFVSDGDPNLPVELISFAASTFANKVTLSWQTATELNNFGFEIQRSADKINFVSVGFVNGFGTTTQMHSYSYEDNIAGKFYYRLKQVDYNGAFEYSDIVETTTLPENFRLSQNYPNPFNPTTTISWQSPLGSWQTLKIYDVLGNEVATLVDEEKPAGIYTINFNAEGLASGIYLYQLKAGNFLETKKFVLLK